MSKFAANLTMLFTELPFLERFAAARDAGFEAVEFLFPGEQVRTAYVEVGDFAAGQAFLQMAAR